MRYLSVCSGIEAATVAWHPLGWKPAAFSEIEKFPRAVLAHHYPDVPCHGDFTTIGEKDYGSIDLLVGGTPCQDFSVAGLRKGITGERGNLTLEFIRLAQRKKPRWLVWENVPGVLSSDGGRAFGAFLGGLAECGYGFAWRILDAQYFGVPQRRRRVFVVGYLGDWRPPAAVLFERESLCGDITPRREERQGITYNVAPCIGASGRGFERTGETRGQDCLIPETAWALQERDAKGADSSTKECHLIPCAIPTQLGLRGADTSNTTREGIGIGEEGDPMFTLQAAHQHAVAYDTRSGMAPHGSMKGDIVCPTLRAKEREPPMIMHDIHAVAFEPGSIARNAGPSGLSDNCSTLRAEMGDNQPAILANMQVRRLTPRECERLQGFPDDYTKVSDKTADGSRYKALGNSMAVPVMKWIGERIKKIEELQNAR